MTASNSHNASLQERLWRWHNLPLFFILCLAALLRILASVDALWLDEIWSLEIVQGLSSISQIFSQVRSDNSHIINSAWLYVWGWDTPPILLRLPSIIFSVGSVYLAWRVSRDVFGNSGLLAACLWAFSYILILYGSEARGYASCLFFALWVFLLTQRFDTKRVASASLIYTSLCVLGYLSHLSFVILHFSLLIWTILLCFSDRKNKDRVTLLLIQIPSWLLLAIFYYFYIRELTPGSGPLRSYLEVGLEGFSVFMTALQFSPANGVVTSVGLASSLFLIAFLVNQLHCLRADNKALALLLFIIIFIAPFLIVVVLQPRVLFVRYLFLPLSFGLLLMACGLERLKNKAKTSAATLFLLVYMLGNLYSYFLLLRDGRNSFGALLAVMGAQSAAPIKLATSQPFRLAKLIKYQEQLDPASFKLQLLEDPNQADWFALQNQDQWFEPSMQLDVEEAKFNLVASFKAAPLSGLNVHLYRRLR